MTESVNVKKRGVTVADTKVSFIDGLEGVLVYRGYRIEDLARNTTFPEVAYLLLHETLPNSRQIADFNKQLQEASKLPAYLYESFQHLPADATPMDPRAKFLKEMALSMGKETGQEKLVDLTIQVEQAALAEFEKYGKTEIKPNIDFYSASVYHLLGIPSDLMTPIFAISRIAGWTAHIIEKKTGEAQVKPALYRPKAEYVGQYCGLMGCSFTPLEKRK